MRLLLTSIALMLSLSASAQLYVSPEGCDTADGSAKNPLATLEGARNRARELHKSTSDTVFINVQSGFYPVTRALELGPEDALTVYQGPAEDRPVVCGGRRTGRFELSGEGLWKVYIPEVAELGTYFEQLYINGERRFRAQTPNRGNFSHPVRMEETILSQSPAFGIQKMKVGADMLSALSEIRRAEWNDVVMMAYSKWDNTRKRLMLVDVADSSISWCGLPMPSYNTLDKDTRYVIENYRAALDAPGEWYLDRSGWLYYMPLEGETIQNTECIYPVAEGLVSIKGTKDAPVKGIRFENIRLEGTSTLTPQTGRDPHQAAAFLGAVVTLDYSTGISFKNCDIAHTGHYAFWFRDHCSYSSVEHCHMYDLGGGGVKIGHYELPGFTDEGYALTHHITIDNNIIQDCGNVAPAAVGVIIFHGSDNVVTHNDIGNLRYSGVSVGWVWGYDPSASKRNHIDFNHIHHIGWGELSDMGGVYTLGASEGTTVNNNVIHHIHSYDYGGWGLYTDEGSYDIHMENNLVYRCKDSGFHQHYGRENFIRNNVFAFNHISQMQFTRVEDHLSFTFSHNIIYYDEGQLYMSMGSNVWAKAKVDVDYNCFYDLRTKDPVFYISTGFWKIRRGGTFDPDKDAVLNFDAWKKLGRDAHSVIADPLFVDAASYDFRLRSTKVARKIGFKPVDYSRAGVYGDEAWKALAASGSEVDAQFEQVAKKYK